ncbi:MAG TPA: hypothetical protein VK550_17800 [Polyangiaceae bacterium]|jgi:hypothetical protein|nr:hypothetical protein [Polyangiaceae bacterium]
MRKPPEKLYAVCCGECGVYIGAEPTKTQAAKHLANNCPLSHSDVPTVIDGPYRPKEAPR